MRRYQCSRCKRRFSDATHHPAKWQKKRHKNFPLRKALTSLVSERRAARDLGLSRTTVARKLVWLGRRAEENLRLRNAAQAPAEHVQFDDMETFEHTKLKPLAITLVVERGSRRILGLKVAQMAAKGRLAKRAVKKYGPRSDGRARARDELFTEIKTLVAPHALIESDMNPHYAPDVWRHFPAATYRMHKGQRGAVVGQGELKKTRFDPLFSLNHTCAMFRANVSRLIRRTWNTTKLRSRLSLHLAIYADYHNSRLAGSS